MYVTLRHRDGSEKTFFAKNTFDEISTLKAVIKQTHEDDDTGYFFETEDADPEYIERLRKQGYPIFKDEFGVEVSCDVVEFEW